MPPGTTEQTDLLVGVDVGGTFTDLVAFDPADGTLHVVKIPSTPPDFHTAVIEAVGRVRVVDRGLRVVHGSTVATNALLQRAGEPVAFVTTEGFRDMLLIGRQNRPELYALNVRRPPPITPPENWFTVRERVDARGNIIVPLSERAVDELIAAIRGRGLQHVAVCLLFSFINPDHEELIADRCRAAGLTVSLSSEILPEFREYERASTTAINASLRPTVQSYLEALEKGLGEGSGFRVQGSGQDTGFRVQGSGGEKAASSSSLNPEPRTLTTPNEPRTLTTPNPPLTTPFDLRITQSAGGTLSPTEAAASAAKLVLSGPAGGVMGAGFVAKLVGQGDVITYDMGGTSTDVAVVLDGQPQWTTSSTVDGLPLGLPMFDIRTVGAGGGSIASIDAGGALRVGPRSAGARPGPACYARGGCEPTVTDANVLLGRIVPERFLGGEMVLRRELAEQAIEALARDLGKSVTETALGIVRVAEANMASAVRAVTSRRGHDPRRFALLSFGGAGGLHACALADALEIPRVIVPPHAGVLSALGMVVAAPVADASRTVVHLSGQLDDHEIEAIYSELCAEAARTLPDAQTRTTEYHADVRFQGQSHEVKVQLDHLTRTHISRRFHSRYRELYGRHPRGRLVEIVTLRVRRVGPAPDVTLPTLEPTTSERRQTRLVLPNGETANADLVTRQDLIGKDARRGPMLLIDPVATTFIPPHWQASATAEGIVHLENAHD